MKKYSKKNNPPVLTCRVERNHRAFIVLSEVAFIHNTGIHYAKIIQQRSAVTLWRSDQ